MKTFNFDSLITESELTTMLEKEGYVLTKDKSKSVGRHKPAKGEKYWVPTGYGESEDFMFANDGADRENLAKGYCHRTEEECTAAGQRRQALVRVQDKYEEFLDGVVLDWEDVLEPKYNNYYNHQLHSWGKVVNRTVQHLPKEMYSTKKGCEWVALNMQGDLSLIYGKASEY